MPWQAKTEFTPLVLQPARTSVPPSAQIRTTAAAVVRSAPVVLTASGYAKVVRAASSAILVSRGTVMAIAAMVARLTWKKIQRTVELVVWLATSRRTAIRRDPEVALARCIVLRDSSFGITIYNNVTSCLPIQNVVSNCGGCGKTCANVLNGDATCSAGAYGLSCHSGFPKLRPQCQQRMRGRHQQRSS